MNGVYRGGRYGRRRARMETAKGCLSGVILFLSTIIVLAFLAAIGLYGWSMVFGL